MPNRTRKLIPASLPPSFAEGKAAFSRAGKGKGADDAARAGILRVASQAAPRGAVHRTTAAGVVARRSGVLPAGLKRADFNGLPFRRMTAAGCKVAGRRIAAVLRCLALIRQGHSLNGAARKMGEPVGNLHSWLSKYSKGGFPNVIPGASTGRRSIVGIYQIATAELVAIAELAETRGIDAACREYAARPDTRPELARYFQTRPRVPAVLRAAINKARTQKGVARAR